MRKKSEPDHPVDETPIAPEAPVEMTATDPPPEAEIAPEEPTVEDWVEKAKQIEQEKLIDQADISDEVSLKNWVKTSKKVETKRIADLPKPVEAAQSVEQGIEEQVAEKFPDSYRITNWAGHKNYECNKCGFADLDKFKLYAHLIQAHSGIEYDYRGETTHS